MAVSVETSPLGSEVLALTVEQWVDLDPQVEIVLRMPDGRPVVLCPSRERYEQLVRDGLAVFSPKEVLVLLAARGLAGDDVAALAELRAMAARVVEAKRAIPGLRLSSVGDLR